MNFEQLRESNYYTTTEFISNFKNNTQHFSLLHINSRSLNKNFDSFETLLSALNNFPFSAIGVTETWLNSISAPLFNLKNYTMIRADREGRRGGGVALYVHEQIQYNIRHDMIFQETENLFIEIEIPKGKNIVIGLIYRPPNSNFETFYRDFENCLNILAQENKSIYLMGDFNINMSNAITENINYNINKINNNTDRFLHLMYSNALHPHINKPTRIDAVSSTLIDNVFSNIFDKDIIGGLLYCEISDHLPIFTICRHSTNMNPTQKPHPLLY